MSLSKFAAEGCGNCAQDHTKGCRTAADRPTRSRFLSYLPRLSIAGGRIGGLSLRRSLVGGRTGLSFQLIDLLLDRRRERGLRSFAAVADGKVSETGGSANEAAGCAGQEH